MNSNTDTFFSTEDRQRINLSDETKLVLDSDRKYFFKEEITYSKFINLIFETYFFNSDANLDKVLGNEKERITGIIGEKYPEVLKKLLADKRKQIKEEIGTLTKKNSILIRLQTRNSESLSEIGTTSENFKCYKKRGTLLNFFLSKYASLSEVERMIICKDQIIKKLKYCISTRTKATVEIKNSKSISFLPVSISENKESGIPYIIDSKSSYVYFIGFTSNNPNDLIQIRLDMIYSVASGSEQFTLTGQQKEQISLFCKRGYCMFGTYDEISVDVRFTDRGLYLLNAIKWLRPEFIADTDDTHLFHFFCTKNNAVFYFQRFGGEAIVISPTDVRDELTQFYQNSLEAYLK